MEEEEEGGEEEDGHPSLCPHGLCLFKKSLGYPKSVSTAFLPQALGITRSPFHTGSALHTIGGNIHPFSPGVLLWSHRLRYHRYHHHHHLS